MYPSAKEKSAYEKQTGKEPNTIKKLPMNSFRYISEPQAMKLDETDFESGQDSTILVRERSRGTKLEGAFKKRKGVLLEQSKYTITFLPAGKKQPTIISRDTKKRQNWQSDNRTKWQLQASSQTQPISQKSSSYQPLQPIKTRQNKHRQSNKRNHQPLKN